MSSTFNSKLKLNRSNDAIYESMPRKALLKPVEDYFSGRKGTEKASWWERKRERERRKLNNRYEAAVEPGERELEGSSWGIHPREIRYTHV